MVFVAPDDKDVDLTYAAGDVIVWVGAPNVYPPVAFEDIDTITSADYRCLGWIDTSGYIFKLDSNTKEIPAAGTLASIRTIITGGVKTVQFNCLEALNPYVRALYDDVPIFPLTSMPLKPSTGTIGSYIIPDPPGDNRYSMVFDSVDGTRKNRLYAPNCKITNRGNDQVQQADIEALEMTATMYPGTIGGTPSSVAKRYIDFSTGYDANFFATRA
jgi:hypothetical protein